MDALARRKVVLTLIATFAIAHEERRLASSTFDLQNRSMRADVRGDERR
jgi:hypothetical protein